MKRLEGAGINRIIVKSLLIWVSIIPLAIANGALREYVLIPLIGKAAHAVSGVILCGLIYLAASVFLTRLGRGQKRTYIQMGLVWVVCTVLFETLLGMISGDSPSVILNNYNLLTGNLWLLVVIFIGFVPWLAAKGKRII